MIKKIVKGMIVLVAMAGLSWAESVTNKVDIGAMDHKAQTDLFRRSRESFANDPYRPLYHFSPPAQRIHDPAGLCWWQGKYHMFYLRYNSEDQEPRGHAVSTDLVHWQDLPALPEGFKGATGTVWADNDKVIMSWGSRPPTQDKRITLGTASDPLLLDWVQHPNNPVPGDDNYIWKEGSIYYLTKRAGAGWKPGWEFLTGRTTLKLLRSKDLATWESLGDFLDDGYYTEPGEDGACPNFIPIGRDKYLLLFFSHKRSSQYYIGTFDREKGRFAIENHGRMNYGSVARGSLHAPSAFIDQNCRCIAVWNITENRQQKGWSQILSLPRHLSLNTETLNKDIDRQFAGSLNYLNPLLINPIEELKSLRFNPVTIESMTIPANGEKVLSGVSGKAMELEVEIDPMKAREVGLNILRSPDGREQTTITLFMQGWERNNNMRELAIDVSRASLDSTVDSRSPEIGPLYLANGEPLRLRVFIDRSVVEVFANGRQCLTLRTYPSLEDSTGVSVFARGSEAKLNSLTAHQMRSIWPEFKAMEGK